MGEKQQEEKRENGRELYEWVQALVGSVLVVVLVFTFVIRLIGVDGHSMVPTLQDGDRLLVLNSMLYDDYKYGDIVILRKNGVFDNEPIVKRVIATEGQIVDMDFVNGIVYVDGLPLEEDYINTPTNLDEGSVFPQIVEEDHVFVMGDNRNNSKDSRSLEIGQVDKREVLGKVALLMVPGTDHGAEARDVHRIGTVK